MSSAFKKHNQTIGRLGENIAADFLKKSGYKILERNCRYRFGEIDIIAEKDQVIIFVEVKAGIYDKDFIPEYHFSIKKAKNLLRVCYLYLDKHKISLERPWQIDLISVELTPRLKKKTVRHWQNVIEDKW